MPRPKSASYNQEPGNSGEVAPEPPSSPAKGILMTPGSAIAKRKTVSFGDHIKDKQDDLPARSGGSDDCSAKTPNSWPRTDADEDQAEERAQRKRNNSSLTKALEQVRDESAKRKRVGRGKILNADEEALAQDLVHPESESGKYWKTEYDVYRENTQREVRKLVKKQQMAKSFAKIKDDECLALTDELRRERLNAERLERKTAELEDLLKTCQAQLRDAQAGEGQPSKAPVPSQDVAPSRYSGRATTQREPRAVHVDRSGEINERQEVEQAIDPELLPPRTDHNVRSATEKQERRQELADVKNQAQPEKPRITARPVRTPANNDIGIQPLSSAVPDLASKVDQVPPSPTNGRTVTCGTGATPLRSLNINAGPVNRLTRRDSAQASPPDDSKAQSVSANPASEQVGPILPSLAQPVQSVERAALTGPRDYKPISRRVDALDESSVPLSASSPFQPNAMLLSTAPNAKRSYAPTSTETSKLKENQAPSNDKWTAGPDPVKPSAAWTAISAPTPAVAGRRVTSLTDKNGKEVGQDRLEAARARIRAKGRAVS